MARIRPATVVAQSLASSGRKSQSTRSCKTSSNASVMVGWQNVSFGHNARRSREHICVFYDALLRVLAVGEVFDTRGTRDVSRQHLHQLSGIASESLAHSHEQTIVTMGVCFVVFRTKIAMDSRFTRAACVVLIELCCSWLSACGRMRSRGMCHEWHAKTHIFCLKMTDLKNKNLSLPWVAFRAKPCFAS